MVDSGGTADFGVATDIEVLELCGSLDNTGGGTTKVARTVSNNTDNTGTGDFIETGDATVGSETGGAVKGSRS